MTNILSPHPALTRGFVECVEAMRPPLTVSRYLPIRVRTIYELEVGAAAYLAGTPVPSLILHPALDGRKFRVRPHGKWGHGWTVERLS